MSNSSSSLTILIAGMLTIPSTIHASDFRHYEPIYVKDDNKLVTESITKIYSTNIDILELAKQDLQKADLNIIAVNNYIEHDEELGDMKIIDIFVQSNDISINEIVSLNMEIINKYSLFENKIIFMVHVA